MSSFIEQLKWQILLDCGVLVVNKSLSAPALWWAQRDKFSHQILVCDDKTVTRLHREKEWDLDRVVKVKLVHRKRGQDPYN